MVDETLQPALTADEWASLEITDKACEGVLIENGRLIAISEAGYNKMPLDPAKMAALANHALPDGHPLKITRAMVDELESCVDFAIGQSCANEPAIGRAAIAALRALLPPDDAAR